jgi:amidase
MAAPGYVFGKRQEETVTDIAFAPARRLAAMVRKRKISCLELLDHYVSRVERYNPLLNAIVVTDLPAARNQARLADRALAKGEVWGPFHGVPMTVKEAIQVAGLPTTFGAPQYRDNIARTDALVVRRWRKSGAVVFGKTNVPIWLMDHQSFNEIYGVTKNPWDLTRSPGGSSGGAAAAVASGLTGIEVGSDIASSIRNPAHCCGIFGHKPTYDICPMRGHDVGQSLAGDDIAVIGPLARSAGDLDLALSVMAGPDEIEAAGYRLALPPPRRKVLKDFRVGIIVSDPVSDTDRDVRHLLQKLADFLARKKVKISDKARPAFDMARLKQLFLVMLRGATSHRQTDAQFADNLKAARLLDPDDQGALACHLRGNTLYHRDWLALHEERTRMRWTWHEFFKDYDLLLCPVTPIPAFPHIHDVLPLDRTYMINGKARSHPDLLFWSGYSGLAYLPATVAPIGFTPQGLPVGVQIVGPHFGDHTTIHFAKLLEADYQSFASPPGFE